MSDVWRCVTCVRCLMGGGCDVIYSSSASLDDGRSSSVRSHSRGTGFLCLVFQSPGEPVLPRLLDWQEEEPSQVDLNLVKVAQYKEVWGEREEKNWKGVYLFFFPRQMLSILSEDASPSQLTCTQQHWARERVVLHTRLADIHARQEAAETRHAREQVKTQVRGETKMSTV